MTNKAFRVLGGSSRAVVYSTVVLVLGGVLSYTASSEPLEVFNACVHFFFLRTSTPSGIWDQACEPPEVRSYAHPRARTNTT